MPRHTLAFCGNPLGAGFELGSAVARGSMTAAYAMAARLNILEAIRVKELRQGRAERKADPEWSEIGTIAVEVTDRESAKERCEKTEEKCIRRRLSSIFVCGNSVS